MPCCAVRDKARGRSPVSDPTLHPAAPIPASSAAAGRGGAGRPGPAGGSGAAGIRGYRSAARSGALLCCLPSRRPSAAGGLRLPPGAAAPMDKYKGEAGSTSVCAPHGTAARSCPPRGHRGRRGWVCGGGQTH